MRRRLFHVQNKRKPGQSSIARLRAAAWLDRGARPLHASCHVPRRTARIAYADLRVVVNWSEELKQRFAPPRWPVSRYNVLPQQRLCCWRI
jgi:hypothetical protein